MKVVQFKTETDCDNCAMELPTGTFIHIEDDKFLMVGQDIKDFNKLLTSYEVSYINYSDYI